MTNLNNQIEIPVNHIFSGGVYIRQIKIPAGALVMGKRHRYETCNILLKGKLVMLSEEDKTPLEVSGPIVFSTLAGAKKFAYCLEDAVFLNILPTMETDPDKIEEIFIIPENEYLDGMKEETKCLS